MSSGPKPCESLYSCAQWHCKFRLCLKASALIWRLQKQLKSVPWVIAQAFLLKTLCFDPCPVGYISLAGWWSCCKFICESFGSLTLQTNLGESWCGSWIIVAPPSDAWMWLIHFSISAAVDQQQISSHFCWPIKIDRDNLGHVLPFFKCNLISVEIKSK